MPLPNNDPYADPNSPPTPVSGRDVLDSLWDDRRGDMAAQPDAGGGNDYRATPETRANPGMSDLFGPDGGAVGARGPVMPNADPTGAPTGTAPGINGRLGDQAETKPRGKDGKALPAKDTYEFYQGEYIPGQGVADADGYFDSKYHSEANIVNNAKRGDEAAYAKLEVMARTNKDAKLVLDDLGPDFLKGETAAGFSAPHNRDIKAQLDAGAYGKNIEARNHLAGQMTDAATSVLPLAQSSPVISEAKQLIVGFGGRDAQFSPDGLEYVDTHGEQHVIPVGQIAEKVQQLKDAAKRNVPDTGPVMPNANAGRNTNDPNDPANFPAPRQYR